MIKSGPRISNPCFFVCGFVVSANLCDTRWPFYKDKHDSPRFSASNFRNHCADKCQNPGSQNSVGFQNVNLRIVNLRVSNPNKLIVDVFFTMSDFNVPRSRPNTNTMTFRKSTVPCVWRRPARWRAPRDSCHSRSYYCMSCCIIVACHTVV